MEGSPRSRRDGPTTRLVRIREGTEDHRRKSRMDRSEIEVRVKKVLAEQLAVDEAQVVPDARFAEDLNADSLDLVEAVLALEEEWSIEIPEDEMESVKTVGQAVDMVASKLGVS
jgi:acyl carrier protein